MKKLIINISESTYDKLRFESIEEKKSIEEILKERIFYKKFSENVEKAWDEIMKEKLETLVG